MNAPAQQWSPPVRIEPGGGYYPQIMALGDTLHVVVDYRSTRHTCLQADKLPAYQSVAIRALKVQSDLREVAGHSIFHSAFRIPHSTFHSTHSQLFSLQYVYMGVKLLGEIV